MIVIEPIGLVIFIGIVAIIIYMLNSEEWKEKLEEKGAFVMSYKDLNPGEEYYYREIPCNGDLYYINKLAKNYCREDEDKESMKDSIKILIESILMDWYYKEIITLDETIQIINEEKIDNEFDKELMQVIKEIIKDKSIRDNKKIGQYFGKWFIHSGDYVEKKFWNQTPDEKRKEIKELLGLKNYLINYSMIEERSFKESKLWGEYLVVANLLGITDKISEEAKHYIPKISLDFELLKEIANQFVEYIKLEKKKKTMLRNK